MQRSCSRFLQIWWVFCLLESHSEAAGGSIKVQSISGISKDSHIFELIFPSSSVFFLNQKYLYFSFISALTEMVSSCSASSCLSSKRAAIVVSRPLGPLVTSASKSAYRFSFAVWPETGQEVSSLHGILGVIVLQRPWVWNLSSLMRRSALVNRLPKHFGQWMDVL